MFRKELLKIVNAATAPYIELVDEADLTFRIKDVGKISVGWLGNISAGEIKANTDRICSFHYHDIGRSNRTLLFHIYSDGDLYINDGNNKFIRILTERKYVASTEKGGINGDGYHDTLFFMSSVAIAHRKALTDLYFK